MSFENKGSIPTTVYVTLEPDRSGNIVCNGAADQTDINLAIDIAGPYGEVKLGRGTFICTGEIQLDQIGTRLIGSGRNATILDFGVTDCTGIDISADWCEAHHLKIDQSGASAVYENSGIYLHAEYCVLSHIWIVDANRNGLLVYGTGADVRYNEISHIVIDTTVLHGVIEDDSGGWNTYNDILVMNAGDTGFEFYKRTPYSVGNNIRVFNSGNDDFAVNSCSFTELTNCISNSPVRSNLFLSAEVDYNCIGNLIENFTGTESADFGIELETLGALLCEHNIINGFYIDCSISADDVALMIGERCRYNEFSDGEIYGGKFGNLILNAATTDYNKFYNVEFRDPESLQNIRFSDAGSYNEFKDCVIRGGTYGIDFTNAGTGNKAIDNSYYGQATAPVLLGGTATVFNVIRGDFPVSNIGGGTAAAAPVINTSPGGVDIDADDEFVYVHIPLPLGLHQVVQIKLWAYSNVIEAANNMLLQIVAHGATSSELWSGNAIDVASHPSEETGGIVQYDVIHWIIDATDDAQVGTLAAQDLVELMAVGEAAGAPDIATDAFFGGWEIEYV